MMDDSFYNSPTLIKAFLEERGFSPRKRAGQNFLVNPRARKLLADGLGSIEGKTVWEIGPGLGAQTRELLARGAKVTAFEIDRGFCGILAELFADDIAAGRLRVIEGDALETWKDAACADFLAGNLPYNIAQLLLCTFIEQGVLFERMVVTVQKEVGARFIAGPGSRDYAPASVLSSFYYTVKTLAALKGASFYPAPKVESSAVSFAQKCASTENAQSTDGIKVKDVSELLRAVFARRRKTMGNNLGDFLARKGAAGGRAAAGRALQAAGIPENARAEALAPEQFLALFRAVEALV
jgi:16S rRNA (adenine1518-N6/adenine1519-N6)-dimethyltransferase